MSEYQQGKDVKALEVRVSNLEDTVQYLVNYINSQEAEQEKEEEKESK